MINAVSRAEAAYVTFVAILSRLQSPLLFAIVLFVNMTMAYLSVPDDRSNLSHIFSKPEDFYSATPYTYWFAALLILVLGPGWIALDTAFRSWLPPRASRW